MTGKLLIVEDEFVIAQDLGRIVTSLGYAVMGMAKSADEAIAKIEKEKPDLALLDINIIGKKNGIELAHEIRKRFGVPFVFVTSYSDTGTLKEMNSASPLGYVLKPFDLRDIRVALEVSFTKIDSPELTDKVKNKTTRSSQKGRSIIGDSPEIREAIKKIGQVAPTDVTVLINGETGTGKELFMEAIHNASPRRDQRLVKVNCAAIPTDLIESILFGHEKGSFTGATEKRLGKFELADGGTIFLDEIGELPLASQSKLLRCLQEKEIETVGGTTTKKVDVRIIAATNKELADEVQKGNFRADLYFRLNIFPITIPKLRDRGEDIVLLAKHFLKYSANRLQKEVTHIAPATLLDFRKYDWPGNVRELQHYIERGVIIAESDELSIEIMERPNEISDHRHKFHLQSLEETERYQITQTLAYCGGKIRGAGGAAEILDLHPNTLDFKIKKLGIKKEKGYAAQ